MKNCDWKNAFGPAPDTFHHQLIQTLNGLEEREMKKRYKLSTLLIAALIVVVAIAGAGIALEKMGLFYLLSGGPKPIVPLDGAEELIEPLENSTENDLAKLTVEKAVYDGQGVLLLMRITPKDPNYIMYNAFSTSGVPEIKTDFAPAEVGEGMMEVGEWQVINENNDKRLLENGIELEIPVSAELAQERQLPVYIENGVLYHADQMEIVAVESTNGRKLMDYWPDVDIEGFEMATGNSQDGTLYVEKVGEVSQQDGSVLIWMNAYTETPIDKDSLQIRCGARVSKGSYEEGVEMDELVISLQKKGELKRARIEPTSSRACGGFEVIGGNMCFSKVRGYLTIDFRYQSINDENMGVKFDLYDGNGEKITANSGSNMHDIGGGLYRSIYEMQSFADFPETVWLEVKSIPENTVLGKVKCTVVQE